MISTPIEAWFVLPELRETLSVTDFSKAYPKIGVLIYSSLRKDIEKHLTQDKLEYVLEAWDKDRDLISINTMIEVFRMGYTIEEVTVNTPSTLFFARRYNV